MTFRPDEYQLIYRDSPMFTHNDAERESLFQPKVSEGKEQYALMSKVYILMKRLNQNHREIMLMDSTERDELFEMEMKLIEEENKKQEN